MYRLALCYILLYAALYFLMSCSVAVVDYVGHCRMASYKFLGFTTHENVECVEAVGLEGTAKDDTDSEKIVNEIVDGVLDGRFDD